MNDHSTHLPLLGFAAYSGTGKTTLLEALLPMLVETGLKVGVLKHAHHDFDVDKPGKDSHRLRKAGASQMLISSRNRHALMTETADAEADFDYLLTRFDSSRLDLILVEGCKNIAFPKIELHREEVGKPWIYTHDSNIIAIAADTQVDSLLPQLSIDDLEGICEFVISYVNNFSNKDQACAGKTKESCGHSSNSGQSSMEESNKAASTCCDILSPAFLSVQQGQDKILSMVSSGDSNESLAIEKSFGRVLASDVVSPIDVPQYTNSAMDGYAIRSDDLDRSEYRVVGEVLAGYAYDNELNIGEAVKIMTGAPTPLSADTVIMREQAIQSGDVVTFSSTNIQAKQNVRQAGEDLSQGQSVFSKGTRIQSPEMGMMASLGFDCCDVKKPLRVAIFSTGDEVQAPGSPQKANTIYDSNRFVLIGLLEKLGCEVIDFGILEDNEQLMIDALEKSSQQADLILTSGGVSVGDADYIKLALEKLGNIDFWRINMRPGRPLAFGHIDNKPFFGLPGNPVAVMVSFINFVEPAIRKMQGQENWQPIKVPAVATEPLRSRIGRTEFSRGIYSIDASGTLSVSTTGKQGSGILRSMSEANCLIEVSPAVDTVKVGESVTIIPLQGRI